ncbi:MAG: ATP-binding protein [Bacteroidales bacterium]|nr:ATP-binding protein [Bacteroidales bacterium]
MDKELLKTIITDQHEIIRNAEIVDREYIFEPNANYVLTGLRRAGKSTLLYRVARNLVESGISWDRIIYINFEDERLSEFKLTDFNDIVSVQAELSEDKGFFFFDEIQIINGWEKFARRLADAKERVYITGSNAKMLSREIETTLGGRFFTKYIMSYNFREYLNAYNVDFSSSAIRSTKLSAKIVNHFETYFTYGGFPELPLYNAKREYAAGVFQKVLLGDIALRNNIRNEQAIRILIKKIAESVMAETSYTKLFNILKTIGLSIGKESVINYVSYSEDAYLIFRIRNYFSKFAESESTPKYYFSDNGLLNLFLSDKKTRLLENVVAISLWQRFSGSVYYLKSAKHNLDIDFYVPENQTAYQVSYSISDYSTREREISAFRTLKEDFSEAKNYVLITYNEEGENDGIKIVPVWKFLIGNE